MVDWTETDKALLAELLARFTTEFENAKSRSAEPLTARSHAAAAPARS